MKISEVVVLMWCWHLVDSVAPCLLGDFNSQVQQLMDYVMLTPHQIYNITTSFDDLQDKLRTRWKGAEVFLFGSVPAGLGTKTSDVDLYARIPNYNDTANAFLVIETAKLLNNNPEKYGDIQQYLQRKVPMLTYYDMSKQIYVDLSFKGDSWHSWKLIPYFMQLDKRYIPLTAVIKFWCTVHNLTGKLTMPNYAMYVLVIFYLQQKKMAPSVSEVQANLPPLIVNKWNNNFKKIPYRVENNETLYELLGDFFKYYSQFNFKEYCVSPFAGEPIARKYFENINTVPETFSVYKTNVKSGDLPLPLKAELCIQDTFKHNANIGRRANKGNALEFMNLVKHAAIMYDELPSDEFFESILVKEKNSVISSYCTAKERPK